MLQTPIVLALILNDKNELLIAKRKDLNISDANDKWEFAGGHIEFGEDPEDAVIRESMEESGLKVKVEKLLSKVYWNLWTNSDGSQEQTFLLSYICRVIGGELKTTDFDPKITELKFIKPEDIKNYDVLPKIIEITELLLNSLTS